ncbi:hypothetical protein PSCT_01260 [Pseudomonas sp. SCT]|nr:hypothetical protein PSCT_01260 [Pseudomonas sp. SCT]
MAVAPKGTKKSCPSHPGLATRDFPHAITAPRVAAQGPSMALYGGTPSSLAASMPLAPLRSDSIRPPERGVWYRLMVCAKKEKPKQTARSSRQLGLRARQEAEWRRCAGGREAGRRARNEGAGTPLRDGPRSNAGRREPRRSRGRMSGALSLWLLSLSREQRESDSAEGPKPKVSAHSVIVLNRTVKAPVSAVNHWQPRSTCQQRHPALSSAQPLLNPRCTQTYSPPAAVSPRSAHCPYHYHHHR